METARRVFDSYFSDTPNPLVRHHLDSYSDLLSKKIPNFIKGKNPLKLILSDTDRSISVYIGGIDGSKIKYVQPTDDLAQTLSAKLPHSCRLNNETYYLQVRVDIDIVYTFEKETVTKTFNDILLGSIPLMLKSQLCYLSSMTSNELFDSGECKFELGGYFIIGGSEKALLTQERLGDNMFYASKRPQVSTSTGKRTVADDDEQTKLEDVTKGEKFEYIAGVKSVSEDGSKGPYSHFLIIPPKNLKPDNPKGNDYSIYSIGRLATITLPGFIEPVPLISVFYALGCTNDQDIYDTIFCGTPDIDRSHYDEIFAEIILSHERFIEQEMQKEKIKPQDPNLFFLRRQTRTRSEGGIYVNLYNDLFPHCEFRDESPSAFYRRKAYLLGKLTRMAIDVATETKPKTDRDHLRFKRLYTSGDLIFREFVDIYKDVAKRMLVELDTRVHFEEQAYKGKKLIELVKPENISYYWRAFNFLSNIEKSFKGKWGGKDGVSQELSRLSYLGTVAQMRRVNVDIDKGIKMVESRRIHGSSWGLLCPSDNPDGSSIGLIKSMTLLCAISTASPSKLLFDDIVKFPYFKNIIFIHPSTWNPSWTKVYLNSDLIGVIQKDTETFHDLLLTKRRNNEIDKFISLCWSRIENEYIIFCDAGRPTRPVYREGTTEKQIKSKWSDIVKHIDYIDAQETESLRISMTPFSLKMPSEIHGLAIFSASASVLPNCDFNAGVRNAFSCQQTKQACAWYNTAFNKRFDTISTWLNYAQRPLAQTWAFKHVLGKNGCLPYGENPVVALMIYSGYNQEDSILLNEGSLRRGMFHTTVYHSYDIAEEALNVGFENGQQVIYNATEIANPATNPKFHETVIRKEGYIYDFLNEDGVIKPGSPVTDETILVGMLTPSTVEGQKQYRDSSKTPKRGQIGIVDAVYNYVTPEGLRGIKIRVAEHRIPVLGDKFSARHGQKGTVGMRVAEEDMPFTSSGIRPDMIVNPHAFPSRMTIGMFIEMMSTKVGVHMGALIDGTPFSTQNRVGQTKDLLIQSGFHPYGHEIMYNGQTGEIMETEVFMGPTHYLRLKQMVEDKINYRATGPKKLLTHQPVEGRSNDGGLRIGEMERDVLISHGISKFLNESLMERSDKSEALFQAETGLFDANTELESTKLTIPYALSLVVHELESMHISMKLVSGSS